MIFPSFHSLCPSLPYYVIWLVLFLPSFIPFFLPSFLPSCLLYFFLPFLLSFSFSLLLFGFLVFSLSLHVVVFFVPYVLLLFLSFVVFCIFVINLCLFLPLFPSFSSSFFPILSFLLSLSSLSLPRAQCFLCMPSFRHRSDQHPCLLPTSCAIKRQSGSSKSAKLGGKRSKLRAKPRPFISCKQCLVPILKGHRSSFANNCCANHTAS